MKTHRRFVPQLCLCDSCVAADPARAAMRAAEHRDMRRNLTKQPRDPEVANG
jgi:hypothetical protein